MRNLLFAVGSLGVAICSALLIVAVLASVFVGRELSGTEKIIACVIACVAGLVLWGAVQRKIKREGYRDL
jgi:ABC-type uncharacterized transport system permease subunit